jgi:serine O-acetyltransferase
MQPLHFYELKYLIRSDLYRYYAKTNATFFLKCLLGSSDPGFKYSFWMRVCSHLHKRPFSRFSLLFIARKILSHYEFKFGISVPYRTSIDSGFYISHFGGIIVSEQAVIGKNCNISQGVTIGATNRGEKKGAPLIGDNVYIGPGAKIIGKVILGNNVAIGANCVVTKDMPDNAVVIGIPGRVISYKGSQGYINRTDY